jgi:hypothetical protein
MARRSWDRGRALYFGYSNCNVHIKCDRLINLVFNLPWSLIKLLRVSSQYIYIDNLF